jgi:hypothetical protein
MYGVKEPRNLLEVDALRVLLAKTMDMKCKVPKSLGAKFFASWGQYEGGACLRVWREKA